MAINQGKVVNLLDTYGQIQPGHAPDGGAWMLAVQLWAPRRMRNMWRRLWGVHITVDEQSHMTCSISMMTGKTCMLMVTLCRFTEGSSNHMACFSSIFTLMTPSSPP